ncbi:denticleless protein homolog isoform X3 [Hydra vulgaris]|uniref:Denticleless protein homolog isoform X3 n=2 Tax=Hydra vulgaris TaxID=6087 RepID=A0ABM4CHR1_HYDVU
MPSDINFVLRRSYVPFITYQTKVFAANRLVENLSSCLDDEYHIEGEMGMPLPPFVAKFSDELLHGNMLGVADEDGHVKLIDSRKTKNSSLVKEWSAHSNAVFDIAWVNNDTKMATASGDQTARVWDIEKSETTAIFRGHTCSLKSVAVQPNSSAVFLTGARDGNIMSWDTRCYMKNGFYNPVNTITNAHCIQQNSQLPVKQRKSRRNSMYNSTDLKTSVTAALFQNENIIISSGACDGALKYWDIRKVYTVHKGEPVAYHVIQFPGKSHRKHGYTSLVLNSTSSRLYAVCTNDVVYEYSTSNMSSTPLSIYEGLQSSSFYVKAALSPDDGFLLCGSNDCQAYIWKTNSSDKRPWVLKGHHGEVTSVTWSPNLGDKVVTCSDDNTFKIWRLFQDSSKIQITGTCEKKESQPVVTLDDILPGPVSLENKTLLKNCSCLPLHISSNQKLHASWTFDQRCSIFEKMKSKLLEESHFTSMTPKTPTLNNTSATNQYFTPMLNNVESATNQYFTPKAARMTSYTPFLKLSTPNNLMTKARSLPATCNIESSVPKTTCSSLETWLKSINTNMRLVSDIGSKNCESTKEVLSNSSQNIISNLTSNRTNLGGVKEGINKTNVKYKKLDINMVNRRDVLSLNIAELFLSGKRKRQSDGTAQCLKQSKKDKENITSESSCSISRDDNRGVVPRIKDLLDHAEDSSQT